MKAKPHTFSKKDIGANVTFKGFDGGSYSATITNAGGGPGGFVQIKYFPTGRQPVFATLQRVDWHRLTRFGAASFLVLEN